MKQFKLAVLFLTLSVIAALTTIRKELNNFTLSPIDRANLR